MTNKSADPATIALASYLQCQAALAGTARTAPAQVLPWALASYIAGAEPPAGLVDRVRADLGLYRLYRDLLTTRSQAWSFRQAAASSDPPSDERSGKGFRLEFRRSRATPGQIYATVVLDSPNTTERGLQVHVLGEDALLRLDFPAPFDGRSQRLFPANSPELSLLRRIDSELVLVTL